MNIVVIRVLCVAIMLVVMAIIYVILEILGKKGVKIFKNGLIRWTLTFALGIFLFLFGAKFILT